MGFYGAPRHVELAGDLGVIATLQKQFDNLPFARPQPNGLLLHQTSLYLPFANRPSAAWG